MAYIGKQPKKLGAGEDLPSQAGQTGKFLKSDGSTASWAESDGSPSITDNGTETAITIDSSENVGIGTVSPNAPLNVVSNSGAEALTVNGRTADDVGQITFYENDGSTTLTYMQSHNDIFKLNTYTAIPLTFGTNNTERLRIDTSGRVTMPNQPSFAARTTTGSVSITEDAYTVMSLNSTDFDKGSNFNTSNSRFTAPVAGTYLFAWTIQVQSITDAPTWYYWYPIKNGSWASGSAGMTLADQVEPTGTYHAIKGTMMLDLAANDYIELGYHWNSGDGDIKGGGESVFSGQLLS